MTGDEDAGGGEVVLLVDVVDDDAFDDGVDVDADDETTVGCTVAVGGGGAGCWVLDEVVVDDGEPGRIIGPAGW